MKTYTTPHEKPVWDADMEYWLNDELSVVLYIDSDFLKACSGEIETKGALRPMDEVTK